MKRSALLSLLLLIIFTGIVHSANLSEVSVRLDRQKAGSPLSGYICATPSSPSAGTEAKVAVKFPNDFTLDSTLSHWNTSTSTLPSGATVWPGTPTIESISGTTVTFTSGDLTAANLYCFAFSGGSSTLGTAGEKSFSVMTKTSGNSIIDITNFTQNVTSNDRVTLSATVPADATDYQVTLTKTDPASSTVQQETTLSYSLAYNTSLTTPATMTIEADWSLGTISGSGAPSVELLSYVSGSASDAYNSTEPVIDLVNRKITWTITSFAHTAVDQEVTFQLKTNAAYTGSSPVSFSVNGRILGIGVQSTDSTVTTTYQYPQNSPTATPTSQPTSTPTPTPTPAKNSFSGITITEITQDTATIIISLTQPSTLIVEYGTSPFTLNQRIISQQSRISHDVTLSNLQPETQYFFRIKATNAEKSIITSDRLTITTASPSTPPVINLASIVVIGGGNILFNQTLANGNDQSPIVLTQNVSHQISFSLQDARNIKRVQLSLIKNRVLGLSSEPSNNGEMVEIRPGVFSGKVDTHLPADRYELYATIYDVAGNIATEKIGELIIVQPITVVTQHSKEPIEKAQLRLSIYNTQKKIYEPISHQQLSLPSPFVTNAQGQTEVSLPPGKYRLEVRALGFKTKTVDFTIGANVTSSYPTVELEQDVFNIVTSTLYVKEITTDFLTSLDTFIRSLILSNRFFHLIDIVVVSMFVLITILAFSRRIGLPLAHLHHYTLGHTSSRIRKTSERIQSTVIDASTNLPIANVHVFLLDQVTGAVRDAGVTNQKGIFTVRIPSHAGRLLMVKNAYQTLEKEISPEQHLSDDTFYLESNTQQTGILVLLTNAISVVIERLFEILLILTILCEFMLGRYFGFAEAMPFLLLSGFNLYLFIYHSRQTRR